MHSIVPGSQKRVYMLFPLIVVVIITIRGGISCGLEGNKIKEQVYYSNYSFLYISGSTMIRRLGQVTATAYHGLK